MLKIECPNPQCDKSYNVDAEKIGKRLKCECGETFCVDSSGSTQSIRKQSVPIKSDNQDPLPPERSSLRPPLPATASNQKGNAAKETSAPSAADTTAEIPRQIGRFEIQSVLGAGAFGKVYRARDPLMDREVALKVPLASTFESEEALLRFLREAQTAGQLHHPNIVTIYEVAEHDGQIYIASAFIDGRTLDAAIKQGDVTFDQAVAITRQLAEALDYAHGEGIIHRDIKPANIMLDKEGRPHILDFGLARLSDEREKLTHAESAIGTPAYMPPEQAQGKSAHEVGPHSDQYSLGVVLYEMLTGQRPFSGPVDVVLLNVIKSEPPTPRSLRADIPRDLETICQKAMSKDPNYRYASSGDLAEDLERWQQKLPILARRISPPERLYRWSKRNPVIAGLTAAVFLVVLVGFVVSSAFAVEASRRAEAERIAKEKERIAKDEERAARLAEVKAKEEATEAKNKAIEARNEALEAKNEATLARDKAIEAKNAETKAKNALAGALERANRHLYLSSITLAGVKWNSRDYQRVDELLKECPPDQRHWEWHYLQQARSGGRFTSNVVKGHTHAVSSVAFSPHGGYIASGSADETIKIWQVFRVDFLRNTHTLKGHMGHVNSVAFSPGTQLPWIVSGSDDYTAKVWNYETGQELVTLKGHTFQVNCVAFRPSGGAQVVTGSDDQTLKIWDPRTGQEIRTLKIPTREGSTFGVTSVVYTPDGEKIISGDLRGTVRIWDAETGEELRTIKAHSMVSDVAVGPDGNWIVSAGDDDQTVKVWDAETGREIHTLKGHTRFVTSVAVSPDGWRIASGSGDMTVKIWDTASGRELLTVDAGEERVTSLAFDFTGRKLIAGSGGDTVKIWDAGKSLVLREDPDPILKSQSD